MVDHPRNEDPIGVEHIVAVRQFNHFGVGRILRAIQMKLGNLLRGRIILDTQLILLTPEAYGKVERIAIVTPTEGRGVAAILVALAQQLRCVATLPRAQQLAGQQHFIDATADGRGKGEVVVIDRTQIIQRAEIGGEVIGDGVAGARVGEFSAGGCGCFTPRCGVDRGIGWQHATEQ